LKNYKLKIFCDFDGTITKNDVWVNSLGKFIKNQDRFLQLCKDFVDLKISSKHCINEELSLVEDFDFDIFNSYLDTEEIDEHFPNFLKYCEENNFEVIVLSEGLDYYINYILKNNDIKLKLYSNKIICVNSEGNISIRAGFPFSDENCNWCGVSKRNAVISNTNETDNEISVFIGDGVSDGCASNYADIIFAKKNLASYCWKNNITYFEYSNFLDIENKLKKLIINNQIKFRAAAKNNRKDLLIGG
jgi:2-hydroxy-3-keto-5-methylthiopentenyl-1-phosphate phosphatase